MNCIFERTGSMDTNGNPQRDSVIKKFMEKEPLATKESLEALADKCTKDKGADKCETAFKMYQCYWDYRVRAADLI